MTTFAPTARPPNTAIAWATKDEILVEIPCRGLPPYIVRYKKSTKGLAEALNIMIENPSPKAVSFEHPKVRKMTAFNANSDERMRTREILKRRGLI